jgi:hypothetical protein
MAARNRCRSILLGGLIGVAIDAGSGAMNDYEPSVTLTLIPSPFGSEAQRDALFENMIRVTDTKSVASGSKQ